MEIPNAFDSGPVPGLAGDRWHIENRLYCARDSACDEDRCRARVRRPPRNPACSGNAAISIVRPGASSFASPRPTATTPRKPGKLLIPCWKPADPDPFLRRRQSHGATLSGSGVPLPEADSRRRNPFGLLPQTLPDRRTRRRNRYASTGLKNWRAAPPALAVLLA